MSCFGIARKKKTKKHENNEPEIQSTDVASPIPEGQPQPTIADQKPSDEPAPPTQTPPSDGGLTQESDRQTQRDAQKPAKAKSKEKKKSETKLPNPSRASEVLDGRPVTTPVSQEDFERKAKRTASAAAIAKKAVHDVVAKVKSPPIPSSQSSSIAAPEATASSSTAPLPASAAVASADVPAPALSPVVADGSAENGGAIGTAGDARASGSSADSSTVAPPAPAAAAPPVEPAVTADRPASPRAPAADPPLAVEPTPDAASTVEATLEAASEPNAGSPRHDSAAEEIVFLVKVYSAQSVEVAGEFNAWTRVPLKPVLGETDAEGRTLYEGELKFNAHHLRTQPRWQYKFVAGEQWFTDPRMPIHDDGNGHINNYVETNQLLVL